jgi:hypothetical protein
MLHIPAARRADVNGGDRQHNCGRVDRWENEMNDSNKAAIVTGASRGSTFAGKEN